MPNKYSLLLPIKIRHNLQCLFYFIAFALPFISWELTTNQIINFRVFCVVALYAVANGLLFALIGILLSWLRLFWLRIYMTLFFVIAYFLVFALIICKWVFNLQFSPLMLNVVLDTTAAESGEYISTHFTWLSAITVLLVFITLSLLYYFFYKSAYSIKNTSSKIRIIIAISIGLLYGICILNNDLLYANNMFNEVKNIYHDYKDEKAMLAKSNYNYLNTINNIPCYRMNDDTAATVFVLVIGESHSRNHCSLYSYARKTNPLLEKLKPELLLFNDVISPANTTILSLQKMLTFATITNPQPIYTQPSLLDIYNKTGYKTWWISNQQVSGVHDTWSKLYAQKANHQYFVNTTNSWHNYSFDEKIFPYLDTALSDAAKDKFIVLHLIGNHERADRRYSDAFNVFTSINDLPAVSPAASNKGKEYVNYYDNSVLYNDFILHTIISKLKETGKKVCMLYVSDHGEELCEQSDFYGHNEGATSRYMCEVPFFVWASENYFNTIQQIELQSFVHRPFQTDQLLNSLLDITHIRTQMFDSTKSIFSKYFIPSKRYVNMLDYDSLYRRK